MKRLNFFFYEIQSFIQKRMDYNLLQIIIISTIQMGKWNKANNQPPPSQQFQQNQERRRQLIIEAAKRRREKEKKLEQLNQQMKRKEEEALQKHKQEKRQAYNKYFKPTVPASNMHDKYEQKKKCDKIKNISNPDVSKWKKRGKSEQKIEQGLSRQAPLLQKPTTFSVDIPESVSPKNKISATTKQAQKDFQNQWGEEEEQIIEDLIGSKLLDSLDLDIDTITRGNQYNKRMQEEEKKNQQKQVEEKRNKEIQEMKAMIGYESMLISLDQRQKKHQQVYNVEKNPMKKKKKQKNQQEIFNELKHKKQGQLLGWTELETVEEADDLFSNCTSHKASHSKLSEQKVPQKIGSRKLLDPIPERKTQPKMNKSKQNMRSNQKSKSVEKKTPQSNSNAKMPVPKSQKEINTSKRSNKQIPVKQEDRKNITRIRQTTNNRSNSRQRQKSIEKSASQEKDRRNSKNLENAKVMPKTQQNFKAVQNNPPRPVQSVKPQPTYSVATHEQFFDVESFIKNDLMALNQQQYELQQEIKKLHLESREKVQEVESKNQIRKDYKTSQNLIKHHQNADYESDVYLYSKNIPRTQEELEDSIQKLDDLLIRNQLESKEGSHSNLLEESSHSLIDPLGRPEDFQQQILKLAENISRFEEVPAPQTRGYGHMRRQKNKVYQFIPEEIASESKQMDEISENHRGINMPRPPLLEYSGKTNSINQVNFAQQQDIEKNDLEDSLETMGKIQVNEKLKNILFD